MGYIPEKLGYDNRGNRNAEAYIRANQGNQVIVNVQIFRDYINRYQGCMDRNHHTNHDDCKQ